MKKIDLGQTLTILANIGVIAGIVFLGMEIRQANRIALVTAEYELRNNFSSANDAILTNTELAEFVHQTMALNAPLEGSDIEKARSWVFRNMNVWLAATFAYQNGIATETTFENILDNVRAELRVARSNPDMLAMWRSGYERFPSLHATPVFVMIDELLDEYEQQSVPPSTNER